MDLKRYRDVIIELCFQLGISYAFLTTKACWLYVWPSRFDQTMYGFLERACSCIRPDWRPKSLGLRFAKLQVACKFHFSIYMNKMIICLITSKEWVGKFIVACLVLSYLDHFIKVIIFTMFMVNLSVSSRSVVVVASNLGPSWNLVSPWLSRSVAKRRAGQTKYN